MNTLVNDVTKVTNEMLLSKLNFHVANKVTPSQFNYLAQSKIQLTFQCVINKELAEAILLLNIKNRKINEKHLISLKKQILNDTWVFNGQTISVSNENTLLDGQHRLTAVVKTNKEIVSNLSFGINQNTFSTIDTGANRYAKDTLYLNGYVNVSHLAGAIRLIYNYSLNKTSNGSPIHNKLTNQQVLEFAEKHTQYFWNNLLKQAAIYYKNNGRLMGLSQSEIAGFLYLIKDADQTKIDNFCKILFMAIGRKEDYLSFVARKLTDAKKNTLSTLVYSTKMAYIYKAWNMYLDNSKDKQVRYNPDESYPRLRIR